MPRRDQVQLLQLPEPVLQQVLNHAQPHLAGAARSCKRLRNVCRALPGTKVRLRGMQGLSLVQLPAEETFRGCTFLEYISDVLDMSYVTQAVQHAAWHWPDLEQVHVDMHWSDHGYPGARMHGAMGPLVGLLSQLPSLRVLVLSPVLDLVSLVPLARLTKLEVLGLNLAPTVMPAATTMHHLSALSCLTGLQYLNLTLTSPHPFDLSAAAKPLTCCLPPSLTYLAFNHHPWVAQWVPFIEECTELRCLRLLDVTTRAPIEAHPSALIHALAPRLRKLEALQVLWDRPEQHHLWEEDISPSLDAPPLPLRDGFYFFPTAAFSSLTNLHMLDGTTKYGLVLPTPWHWRQLTALTGLRRLLGVRMLDIPEEGVALRGVTQLAGLLLTRDVTALGLLLPALPAVRGLTLRVEPRMGPPDEIEEPLDIDVAQLQQLLQQQEQEAQQQQKQQQQPPGGQQHGQAAATTSGGQQPSPLAPPPAPAGAAAAVSKPEHPLHANIHLNIGNLAAHWGWSLMRRQLQLRGLEDLELVWPIDSSGHLPDLTGYAASLTSLTFRLTWGDWNIDRDDGAVLVLEDILGVFSGLQQLQELELEDLWVVKPNMVLFLQHPLAHLRRVTLRGRFDTEGWEEGKMQALLRPQLKVECQLTQHAAGGALIAGAPAGMHGPGPGGAWGPMGGVPWPGPGGPWAPPGGIHGPGHGPGGAWGPPGNWLFGDEEEEEEQEEEEEDPYEEDLGYDQGGWSNDGRSDEEGPSEGVPQSPPQAGHEHAAAAGAPEAGYVGYEDPPQGHYEEWEEGPVDDGGWEHGYVSYDEDGW